MFQYLGVKGPETELVMSELKVLRRECKAVLHSLISIFTLTLFKRRDNKIYQKGQ